MQSRVQPEFFAFKELQNFQVLIKCYFGLSCLLNSVSCQLSLTWGCLKSIKSDNFVPGHDRNLLKYLRRKFFRASAVSALFPNTSRINSNISKKTFSKTYHRFFPILIKLLKPEPSFVALLILLRIGSISLSSGLSFSVRAKADTPRASLHSKLRKCKVSKLM